MNPDERVGVVLSGGGARAAYQVGVLKAIYSGQCRTALGNPPELFCGSGAGAYNASVIASRLPGQFPAAIDYLESVWADEMPREGMSRNNRVFRRRLDTAQFFDLPYMWRRPLKSWVQYFRDAGVVLGSSGPESRYDTSPLYRLITESVNPEAIRDGEGRRPHRALRVVAAEKGTGRPQVFGNADFTDDLGHRLVLASCSLPAIFPAVEIRGKQYLYGEPAVSALLQPAIDAGCTVIHLLHTAPGVEKNQTFAGGGRRTVIHQYRPRVAYEGPGGMLDFRREQIEAAIAAGHSDALAHDCAANGCIL